MPTQRSQSIFERARAVIPGGLNSPGRAGRSVGADPVFIASGRGGRVTDADGNEYLDLIGSWGPLILGHCHPEIMAAIQSTMAHGTTFGAPTEIEVAFAEALHAAVPTMEMVRAVSSGTEATMSALRLARGFTGRPRIIKADGGYHGHADCLLVAAGSGAATLGIPGDPGHDGARHDVRRADRERGRVRRGAARGGADDGDGARGVVGHRGDDERAPSPSSAP